MAHAIRPLILKKLNVLESVGLSRNEFKHTDMVNQTLELAEDGQKRVTEYFGGTRAPGTTSHSVRSTNAQPTRKKQKAVHDFFQPLRAGPSREGRLFGNPIHSATNVARNGAVSADDNEVIEILNSDDEFQTKPPTKNNHPSQPVVTQSPGFDDSYFFDDIDEADLHAIMDEIENCQEA